VGHLDDEGIFLRGRASFVPVTASMGRNWCDPFVFTAASIETSERISSVT
jgi:hypothetical protein